MANHPTVNLASCGNSSLESLKQKQMSVIQEYAWKIPLTSEVVLWVLIQSSRRPFASRVPSNWPPIHQSSAHYHNSYSQRII